MSKLRNKLLLLACVLLISVVTAGMALANNVKTGSTVEVTSAQKLMSATVKGTVYGTLSKGTTATVVKVSSGWANIKLTNSGITGWVKLSTLKSIVIKPQIKSLDLVSKISKEYSTASHAESGYELAYAGPRDGCVPCHSGNGLEKYGTAKPYLPSTGIKSNPIATDKTYTDKDPNNAKYTMMFDAYTAELPTPMGCETCHSGTGESIMKSGTIPAALNAITGKTAEYKVGNKNALCLTCHNGRREVQEVYKSWTTPGATKSNTYPHHGWGALVSGKGGMQYPEVTYPQSTGHLTLGCINCHMGKTKEGYTSHTFKPDLATCKTCHPGATEFTLGGGLKKELEAKLVELKGLVLAKVPGAVDIGLTNSTAPMVDKDGKRIPASAITSTEALVGAYNYALVTQELHDGGKGVHNPKYARALLDESIKKLK